MREVQVSEAATDLPRLLDAVQRGETIALTRDGHAVAHLVPAPAVIEPVEDILQRLRTLRERAEPMTTGEILAARNTGRR